MKYFASHLLFIADRGYLQRRVVAVEDGVVRDIFPLTEEIENTEWLPGAILLLETEKMPLINAERIYNKFQPDLLKASDVFIKAVSGYSAIYFPHFDFNALRPACETLHRLLR